MLDYFLLLLISFLSLLFGVFIGYLTIEELKPGLKYLTVLKRLILAALLIMFWIKSTNPILTLIIAIIFLLCSLSKHREKLYYSAFALMLFLSWILGFVGESSLLIFLYGLPTGSIYLYEHIKSFKDKKKILTGLFTEYFFFLIIGLVLGALALLARSF